MPQLPKEPTNLKNNVLPFPVEYMPKDRPRANGWHVLGLLIIVGSAVGLLWLTISALID